MDFYTYFFFTDKRLTVGTLLYCIRDDKSHNSKNECK